MKRKKKKQVTNLDDVIKAMRRGNREGEQDVLGPGFHSTNRVHRSKKTYTRKVCLAAHLCRGFATAFQYLKTLLYLCGKV